MTETIIMNCRTFLISSDEPIFPTTLIPFKTKQKKEKKSKASLCAFRN